MSIRMSLTVIASLVCSATLMAADETEPGQPDKPRPEPSAERGRVAVWSVSSALTATLGSWDSLWKQWGLDQRPEDFLSRAGERYGLHESLRDGDRFPLGLKEAPTPFGVTLGNNCLMCHAGRVAGETVIGLGNASLDLQSLIDDLTAREPIPLPLPFKISNGRGTIEAVAGTLYLMQFRDAELNYQAPIQLQFSDQLWEDMPAWWLLKYKRTMFHTGGTDSRSVRSNVSFFLNPLNSPDFIKSQESVIADIREFILTLEAPRYPFSIDRGLAAQGKSVFGEHCSECHGTYGEDREYPNVIVPVEDIGTDPALATFDGSADLAYYKASWLYREKGPDGEPLHMVNYGGYQAPPLDGVWATAPYFHNGSVPTIAHVLNSKSRPAVYTRSFRTDKDAYDQNRVGWKVTPVDLGDAQRTSRYEQRRITDTSRPGRGNQGHTFGDGLSTSERAALLEYLKTL